MHPNSFLRTYWRLTFRPQVFVAMSFEDAYRRRFSEIIEPAVKTLAPDVLSAYRVDNSKTGDSILTEIIDGIAHSRLFMADVSIVGRDAVSGLPYRNANVLYEVGLALACRLPEEVLLVRDDRDKFLFDVSTVPHLNVNFADATQARKAIADALADRLKAQAFAQDSRVAIAVATLTTMEIEILRELLNDLPTGMARGYKVSGIALGVHDHALGRLLDKGAIEVAGRFSPGLAGYQLTPLGRHVAERASAGLPVLEERPAPPSVAATPPATGPQETST